MADDAGEKTESASPRRRQEARNKGQVARSTDLNAALLLVGGMVGLRLLGPDMLGSLYEAMRRNLAHADPAADAAIDVGALVAERGLMVFGAIGPILLLI